MHRILLLILAFAIPAAADSIDYASAGSLGQHTATVTGQVAAGHMWSVTDVLDEIDDTTTGNITQGNLGKVDITTGMLSSCPAGLCFIGGGVAITSTGGSSIFTGTFTSGTITRSGGNTFLTASLPNGGTVEIESRSGIFSSNTIITTTPEVNSLWLLGSGLLGLSFLRRHLH